MKQGKTVPVSARALLQRINRKLAADGERLKATRGESARQELGNYYVIDTNRNAVLHKDVDVEEFGRKCGVLAAWERVV